MSSSCIYAIQLFFGENRNTPNETKCDEVDGLPEIALGPGQQVQ
jgi:hypothetical protein